MLSKENLELPRDFSSNKILDINDNAISFANNPTLLPQNAKLPLTEQHIQEIYKCSNDIQYFIENYVKVPTLDEGVVNIKLRDYQLKIINNYKNNRFNQIMAGRQSGKSSTILLCLLWEIIFNPNIILGLCCHILSMASENMDRLQNYFMSVPVWLKPGVVRWHKTYIHLDNGSKVYISTAVPDAFRGLSIKVLFIDECVSGKDYVTIRNKETGEIKNVTLRDLYLMRLKNEL